VQSQYLAHRKAYLDGLDQEKSLRAKAEHESRSAMEILAKLEQLFADVSIKNEDVGFVQLGQPAQIKLAAYPFQKYGMLVGKVTHISADSTELARANSPTNASNNTSAFDSTSMAGLAIYKARVQLDAQVLRDPRGEHLPLTPGMQVVAEINQGKRSVLEYLLSPVQKAVAEAGRGR
jgi:hemolysin D